MESANLRDGDDPATWRGFDDSWLGTVIVKRLVWPHGVVVGEVRAQETAQMGVIENEEMVEALSSNRPDALTVTEQCHQECHETRQDPRVRRRARGGGPHRVPDRTQLRC
jgi:hypothetical protein